MAVNTTNIVNGPYVGNGATDQYSYTFRVEDKTQLTVTEYTDLGVETLLTVDTDYTVASIGNDTGGIVTRVAGNLPTDYQWIIRADYKTTQKTVFSSQGGFFPDVHEAAMDKLTFLIQQLQEEIDRAVKVTIISGDDPDALIASLEASEAAAAVSAAASAVSAAAALVSENAAAADLVLTNADVTYAAEWAKKAEDILISIAAGGDGATDYSALHWAAKAQQSALLAANQNLFTESLVKLIHPDQSKGLQDLQRQGVYPVSFQQQWGGMGYGGLPDGTLGEISSGSVATTTGRAFAVSATASTAAQSFKTSKNLTVRELWVKVDKVGDPIDNMTLEIQTDTASAPSGTPVTNGTATAIAGRILSVSEEWVKFTFPINPALTADTQYWIVLDRSGAFSAGNEYGWKTIEVNTYPHGQWARYESGAWNTASYVNTDGCFLIVPESGDQILQSGLTDFDGALHCYEGAPLDQSGAFYFQNTELNHKRGLIHYAGTGFTKDKTFHDSGLATDNNRIVIRCNVTTGYAQVDLYENDETKHTVTGTTDISTGNHIISVSYRSEGDGLDFLKLYVDGESEGTELTSQTLTLDSVFEDGFSVIGGGFPLDPTWTQDLNMSSLPSASGWTFNGTATEGNAFIVNGGILYQNGSGYASTNTGYYQKTVTLNNAIGWVVETKLQIKKSTNTTGKAISAINIFDGTKAIRVYIYEYYIEISDAGGLQKFVHADCARDVVLRAVGKGSDFYLYLDNELIFDGATLLTNATATNSIEFGDITATAAENGTTEWHYLKYYEGVHLPEYSDAQISEFAQWNDDKSSLLSTIYNAGSIQSVKTLAGMSENYVKTVPINLSFRGITADPSTTSATEVPMEDMQMFVFNRSINANLYSTVRNSAGPQDITLNLKVDGNLINDGGTTIPTANYRGVVTVPKNTIVKQMLTFVDGRFLTTGGTASLLGTSRSLNVEAKE